MNAPVTRIALYVRDMEKVAAFYVKHFGFSPEVTGQADKMVLSPAEGGCSLVLLKASKGHRIGQSCVKLVFDVADMAAFKAEREMEGLVFGKIHRGPGYEFANMRDPAGNPIQISSGHLAG